MNVHPSRVGRFRQACAFAATIPRMGQEATFRPRSLSPLRLALAPQRSLHAGIERCYPLGIGGAAFARRGAAGLNIPGFEDSARREWEHRKDQEHYEPHDRLHPKGLTAQESALGAISSSPDLNAAR